MSETTQFHEVAGKALSGARKTKAADGVTVIENARLLGPTSKNGRRYPADVMRKALPLFEGARVYIDHVDSAGPSRGLRDLAGSIFNARIAEDGIRGDVRARGPAAALLIECAENAADIAGFSINAVGKLGETRDGLRTVEEISRVISVDLVDVPATTIGIFESVREGAVSDEVARREQVEKIRNLTSAAERLIWNAFSDTEIDYPEQLKRIKAVVTDLGAELDNLPATLATSESSTVESWCDFAWLDNGGKAADDATPDWARF